MTPAAKQSYRHAFWPVRARPNIFSPTSNETTAILSVHVDQRNSIPGAGAKLGKRARSRDFPYVTSGERPGADIGRTVSIELQVRAKKTTPGQPRVNEGNKRAWSRQMRNVGPLTKLAIPTTVETKDARGLVPEPCNNHWVVAAGR